MWKLRATASPERSPASFRFLYQRAQAVHGAKVIPPLSKWPDDLLVLFYERWNIMEFEGGLETGAAREKAMVDVWPQKELGGK